MKRDEAQQFNAGPYVSYIWSIADDWLRDVYVPSDYRKVILPMVVLRRLDLVLEPTKAKVLEMKRALDGDKVVEQDDALCGAAGQNFCNSSPFTMRELTSRTNPQKLEADFTKYFYKPVKLRELADIAADLKAVEAEAKGLLAEVTE